MFRYKTIAESQIIVLWYIDLHNFNYWIKVMVFKAIHTFCQTAFQKNHPANLISLKLGMTMNISLPSSRLGYLIKKKNC